MQDEKSAIYQMRFPQKLWYLLNLQTDAILWGGTGRTILLNYRVLHSYLLCGHSIFKTNNISSFVRQLNLYGFRKVTSHSQDPLCNSSNPYMHEYIHDYFQYGRPELLNKITRKALTIKKPMKAKIDYNDGQMSVYLTPLQKARQAFKLALQKAAGDMYMQEQSFQPDDMSENYADDEEMIEDKIDWFISKNDEPKNYNQTSHSEKQVYHDVIIPEQKCSFSSSSSSKNMESLITSNDEEHNNQEQNESVGYPNQFLSMPDLEQTNEDQQGIELLAEFDIDNDLDQGITRKTSPKQEKENVDNSFNCVLPSISNEQNFSMMENSGDYPAYYNGEWDHMFCEMLATRTSSQEVGSDFKELYSQIYKTMDLLNS